jgi:hypothetical protein
MDIDFLNRNNTFKLQMTLNRHNARPRLNYYGLPYLPHFSLPSTFKGIDRPFGGGVESILIRSVFVNWRLGKFFLSHFKWPSSQDQQKTIVRRLITSKITLTGQSHFMLIFVLRKATLPNRINSIP